MGGGQAEPRGRAPYASITVFILESDQPCSAISPWPKSSASQGFLHERFFGPTQHLVPRHEITPPPGLPGFGEDAYKLSFSCAASFQLQISLGQKIKTFATKMVITSGNDEDRGGQEKESKEESVLAMLGIIGTILNLIVIIFVYIYTTL